MKYTSTTRLMNLIINSFLFLAFGCAAFYFCFWVNPGFFATGRWSTQSDYFKDYPFNFVMELGMLSMAIMILAIIGIIYSVKSLKQGSKDPDVVKTFMVYCAMGNAVAIFSLLNAVVFYDVIGNGTSPAFFIVLFVVIAIAALLGANIPMTRLLDDKDGHIMQIVFSASFGAILAGYLLSTFLTMILCATDSRDVGGYAARLGIYDGLCLLGLLCCIISIYLAEKKHETKLPAILFGVALVAVGTCFIVDGTLEWLWRRNGSSNEFCYSLTSSNRYFAGMDYMVMAIIAGSLLVIAGAAYSIVGALPEKEKDAKHRA